MTTMKYLSPLVCGSLLAASTSLYLACSPTGHHVFTTSSGGGEGGESGTSTSSATTVNSSSSGGDLFDAGHHDASDNDSGMINCTPGGPDDDVDKDGWTPNQGDCDDCDPN